MKFKTHLIHTTRVKGIDIKLLGIREDTGSPFDNMLPCSWQNGRIIEKTRPITSFQVAVFKPNAVEPVKKTEPTKETALAEAAYRRYIEGIQCERITVL